MCLLSRAGTTDYLSGIAHRAGISIESLLLKNLDVITDLEQPIAGKTLRICDVPFARQPVIAQVGLLVRAGGGGLCCI